MATSADSSELGLDTALSTNTSLGASAILTGTSCPIHSLPDEILIAIFRLVVCPLTPLRDPSWMRRICLRWKSILDSTPSFWTCIREDEGPRRTQRALNLSQNQPLDVIFKCGPYSPVSPKSFMEDIGGSITRWRSLYLWGALQSGLGVMTSAQAPLLERMELKNFARHILLDESEDEAEIAEESEVITLFGGRPAPPTLKHFTLYNLPIALAPLQLSNLKSLTLRRVETASVQDLWQVLSRSPQLELLHLMWNHESELSAVSEGSRARQEIRLPSLREFKLESVLLDVCRLLLSALKLSSSCRLIVDREVYSDPLFSLLVPEIQHINFITQTAQEITLSPLLSRFLVTAGGFSIELYDSEPEIQVVRDAINFMKTRLGPNLSNPRIHLFLQDRYSPPSSSVLRMFDLQDQVTRLSLWSTLSPLSASTIHTFIPLLAQPTASSTNGWILPHLEIFNTNRVFRHGNPDIVDLVRVRNTRALAEPGVPRHLREIWLSLDESEGGADIPPDPEFMRAVLEVADGTEASAGHRLDEFMSEFLKTDYG
ncbi:hypothetical protein FRB90_004738, partial [Tulasnella sp. 427]